MYVYTLADNRKRCKWILDLHCALPTSNEKTISSVGNDDVALFGVLDANSAGECVMVGDDVQPVHTVGGGRNIQRQNSVFDDGYF